MIFNGMLGHDAPGKRRAALAAGARSPKPQPSVVMQYINVAPQSR